MKFFKDLKNSVYGPDFYRQLESEKASSSLKYFLKLAAILAILSSIIYSAVHISTLRAGVFTLLDSFPEGLVIKIDKKAGIIESNSKNPHVWAGDLKSEKLSRDNVFAVNTNETFSFDNLEKYNAIVTIFKDGMAFYDPKTGDVRVIDPKNLPNIELTKTYISSLEAKIDKYWPLIWISFSLILALGMFLFYARYLIEVLLISLFIFILYKLLKSRISWNYSFTMSAHALTLALLADFLLSSVFGFTNSLDNGFFKYISEILTLLVMVFNLKGFGIIPSKDETV